MSLHSNSLFHDRIRFHISIVNLSTFQCPTVLSLSGGGGGAGKD